MTVDWHLLSVHEQDDPQCSTSTVSGTPHGAASHEAGHHHFFFTEEVFKVLVGGWVDTSLIL